MNNILRLAALLTLSIGVSVASDTPSGSVYVTGAVQQFSTTLGRVQKITFRNVPGQCGKIYIGRSNMNTTTLEGVIKVLYPNCSGGIGDEYSIEDKSGVDGIQANDFYFKGDVYGEALLWDAYRTGNQNSALLLQPVRTGPLLNGATWEPFMPISGSNPPMAAIVEAYVVPGHVGKIMIGNLYSAAPRKVLWPNTGQNISDGYRQTAFNGLNDFRADLFQLSVLVAGEFPLVTVWRRQ
jgi:hypothetical protein